MKKVEKDQIVAAAKAKWPDAVGYLPGVATCSLMVIYGLAPSTRDFTISAASFAELLNAIEQTPAQKRGPLTHGAKQ